MGHVSVVFCDWCCAEDGPRRRVWITDPTNPHPPSEGNGHELSLCEECRRPLLSLRFSDFEARRDLNSGVTAVERRSRQ